MSRRNKPAPVDLEHDPVLRVQVTARHIFDDDIQIDMFLHRRQKDLGGRRPIDLAETESGARQVEKLLWAIHADKRL